VIEASLEGEIGVLRLNRPAMRNALGPDDVESLADEAARIGAEARAVLLTGAGKVFCSGFDLKACHADETHETLRRLLIGLDRVIRTLRGLEAPVVVAAHGAAIAGGCAMLGGADVVVADKGAKLGYPVVRIGVSPAVSAPFLSNAVAMGWARSRMLDPGLVSGERACRAGLVHVLVDGPSEVAVRAREIAVELAAKPAWAVRATKGWLNELTDPGDTDGLAASLRLVGNGEQVEMLGAALGAEGR